MVVKQTVALRAFVLFCGAGFGLQAEPVNFLQADLNTETVLIPASRALTTAISETNEAIRLLEDACQREGSERFLTTGVVQQALDTLDHAERNYTLTETLLPPLANRDPAFGKN